MCGIFGVIFHDSSHRSPQSIDEIAYFFSCLAVGAQSRGTDATGLARIDNDGHAAVYKNIVDADKIVRYKRWWRPLYNINPATLALMGHTRFGTHGPNTVDNAHPFTIKGVNGLLVGTHNGVISNHTGFGPKPPFDSDSRNLFHALAHRHMTDWPDQLRLVQGSMALAFATPGAVHLTRNLGNPCELAFLEKHNATVYASTKEIMTWAAQQAKVTLTDHRWVYAGELYTYLPDQREPVKVVWDARPSGFRPKIRHTGTSSLVSLKPKSASESAKVFMDVDMDTYREQLAMEMEYTDDTVLKCDSCNHEDTWPNMFVDPANPQATFCRHCAPTDGAYLKCDMCEQACPIDEVDWDLFSEMYLCVGCRNEVAEGVRGEDSGEYPRPKQYVVMCESCGAEVPQSQYGMHIHWSDALKAYLCNDCAMDPTMPFALSPMVRH